MSGESVNVTEAILAALPGILMPSAFQNSAADSSTVPYAEIGFASTAYILVCTALVMLMTPGVGILYSGLSRSKNALTIVMLCFLGYAVVTIQWVLFGFSLAFSETGGSFMGDFKMGGFVGVASQALKKTEVTTIPAIVFAMYQMQFACVTVAIIFGSVTERIRLLPSIMFMLVWTTVVYDPVTYWTWAAKGWIRNLSCLDTLADGPCHIGGLDFAGGGPVHMASGAAALAFCLFLGARKRNPNEEFKPHNVTNVFLGTALLWFGWFGFNGGSALAASPRAAMASMTTTVSAAAGSLAWVAVDYWRIQKLTGIGFCSGALAGLVVITPAAGFVSVWAALITGLIGGFACSFSIRMKDYFGYDDTLDAFGLHGVGGFLGSVLLGFFADKDLVASLDGGIIEGGVFMNGSWHLLGYNLAGSFAIVGYSFVVTLIILYAINSIPGCYFRPHESDEILGGDLGEMGEVAYELFQARIPLAKSSKKGMNLEVPMSASVKDKIAENAVVQKSSSGKDVEKIPISQPVTQPEVEHIVISNPLPPTELEHIVISAPVPPTETEQVVISAPVPSTEAEKVAISAPVPSIEAEKVAISPSLPSTTDVEQVIISNSSSQPEAALISISNPSSAPEEGNNIAPTTGVTREDSGPSPNDEENVAISIPN